MERELFAISRLYSNIKEKDRGPQFTRGVSPQDNIVLGKQITAGQLTHENAHKDANTRQDEYYEIDWALQKRSQTTIQLHLCLNSPLTEISSKQTMSIKLQTTDYCIK